MGIFSSCNRKPYINGWPAGNELDYAENMINEVAVTENESVLVIKSNGIFHAIGSRCTYCHASLVQGVISYGKIITCPWHKASFDLATGEIYDFPGVDSLPTYRIFKHVNRDLGVLCPETLKPIEVRPIPKWKAPTIVIIGAGPAGFMAAQTLCQNGFEGRILMLTKDCQLPFDKTELSKDLNPQMFRLELKNLKYYKNYGIEFHFSTEVTKINFQKMWIYIKGTDEPIYYNNLLIATGSQTPRLSGILDGAYLRNIRSLNSYKEALELFAAIEAGNKTCVIIGGSFLGLEIATMVSALCAKVIIIGNRRQPLENLIGSTASSLIMQAKDSLFPNVIYVGPEKIKEFKGNNLGEVTHVVTGNHGMIRCDVVILAMNPKPNTAFLNPTDIMMNIITRAVVVDENMQTSVRNVYAAGDMAVSKLSKYSVNHDTVDLNRRGGHVGQALTWTWNVALFQGKVAALRMLGIENSFSTCVPYFWCKIFGFNLRIVGYLKEADGILVYTKIISKGRTSVCSLFRLNSRIIGAVVSSDCDPLASLIASDLRGKRLSEVRYIPPYVTRYFPGESIREMPVE